MNAENLVCLGHVRRKSKTVYGECMLIKWDGRMFLFFVILLAGSAFNLYINIDTYIYLFA